MQFQYDKDILCKVEYDEAADALKLPEGTSSLLAVYNITGISAFSKEAVEKGAVGIPRVQLSFGLDSSGIVSLISATATAEMPVVEEKEEEKKEAEGEVEEKKERETEEKKEGEEGEKKEGEEGEKKEGEKKEGEEGEKKEEDKKATKEDKKFKKAKKEAKKEKVRSDLYARLHAHPHTHITSHHHHHPSILIPLHNYLTPCNPIRTIV